MPTPRGCQVERGLEPGRSKQHGARGCREAGGKDRKEKGKEEEDVEKDDDHHSDDEIEAACARIAYCVLCGVAWRGVAWRGVCGGAWSPLCLYR